MTVDKTNEVEEGFIKLRAHFDRRLVDEFPETPYALKHLIYSQFDLYEYRIRNEASKSNIVPEKSTNIFEACDTLLGSAKVNDNVKLWVIKMLSDMVGEK